MRRRAEETLCKGFSNPTAVESGDNQPLCYKTPELYQHIAQLVEQPVSIIVLALVGSAILSVLGTNFTMRTKQQLICSYKASLDAQPEKVAAMDEGAWYSSLMGLTMRLLLYGLISEDQADSELAPKS